MTWVERGVLYAGRGLGALQALTGVAIWIGVARVPLVAHVLPGALITLLLLAAATLGARAGAAWSRVGVALGWAALLPVFGLAHPRLLVGANHWIVEVLHLAVGIAAIGQIDALARLASQAGAGREREVAG